MSHISDPISGKPTWDALRRHIQYNDGRTAVRGYPSSPAYIHPASPGMYHGQSPRQTQSPSGIYFVSSSPDSGVRSRSPSPVGRRPQPQYAHTSYPAPAPTVVTYPNPGYQRYPRERDPSPGCCGGRRNPPNKRYGDYEGAGRGQRNWGRRRCCTALVAALILLALAGLAVGLYFAITSAQATTLANAPSKRVQGGYSGTYVNGVYVVQVTTKPQDTYLIYGQDTPCNPYNNGTGTVTNPYYPNCNKVTTKMVVANYVNWTTTVPTVATVYIAGSQGLASYGLFFSCFLPIIGIIIAG